MTNKESQKLALLCIHAAKVMSASQIWVGLWWFTNRHDVILKDFSLSGSEKQHNHVSQMEEIKETWPRFLVVMYRFTISNLTSVI